MRNTKQAFTLIELLVVVLIIGILAAVALPQYQKAVEKSRMAEAVTLVRTIANAHQLYHIETGEYARATNMDLLSISIPGTPITTGPFQGRIKTKDFVYSPRGSANNELAVAQRIPEAEKYYIVIYQNTPQRIECKAYSSASSIQKQLCNQLNANGTL